MRTTRCETRRCSCSKDVWTKPIDRRGSRSTIRFVQPSLLHERRRGAERLLRIRLSRRSDLRPHYSSRERLNTGANR